MPRFNFDGFSLSYFLPLTIAYAELPVVFRALQRLSAVAPWGASVYGDVVIDLLSRDPEPSAAVLHGLLTGRLAPHPADREKMEPPALIIGHGRDLLHPFSDAAALHRELRNSDLVQARSFLELRFPPNGLSERISVWLDEVWA